MIRFVLGPERQIVPDLAARLPGRGMWLSARADVIETARAKGVCKRTIVFVHALRNAMLPVMTVAGDQAAGMINGAVIVEMIFGFPGIGKLMIDSISNREFVIVQAAVIVVAVTIFLMNFLIDLAYVALDPRIRHN